jgi:hypothetical protein
MFEMFLKYLIRTPKVVFDNAISLRFRFPNNYGASVIQNDHSYGGKEGLFELAILYNDNIHYDSPLANDVIGWLSPKDVVSYLLKIKGLDDPKLVEEETHPKDYENLVKAHDKHSGINLADDVASASPMAVDPASDIEGFYASYESSDKYVLVLWPEAQIYHDKDKYPKAQPYVTTYPEDWNNNMTGAMFVPCEYIKDQGPELEFDND